MDGKTAWDLWKAGQPVSLIIKGRRYDEVMISGLEIPGDMLKLLLRTPVGEYDRRMRVHIDDAELAPEASSANPLA